MSKLAQQKALPRPAMFQNVTASKAATPKRTIRLNSPEADDLAQTLTQAARAMPALDDPAAPLNAVSKPRKAKEAPSMSAGPFDYAATIARLGLSPADAASLLRIAPRTARRWNTDSAPDWVQGYLALAEAMGLDSARDVIAALPDPTRETLLPVNAADA